MTEKSKISLAANDAWMALEPKLDDVCIQWEDLMKRYDLTPQEMCQAINIGSGDDLGDYWIEWYGEE